jgi:carbon storage regulator CsrA
MRCFTRNAGQKLRIGEDVILTVTSVRGGSVRLGFIVPKEMIVDREEIAEFKKRERVAGNLQYAAQIRVEAGTKTETGADKKPRAAKTSVTRRRP